MITKKKCDTNKNLTKMGVIIKRVYCRGFEGNKERPDQCWPVIVFFNNCQACFLFEVSRSHRLSISRKIDSHKKFIKKLGY